jgi:hypothetical protein
VRVACASQLIDSGNREYAAKAAFDLGLLLTSRDDPAGAVDAYRTAVDSGHPEVVGVAGTTWARRSLPGTTRLAIKSYHC